MPMIARLARARASAVVTCLVLAGSATGALGADASTSLPTRSASALLGVSRSVPQPGSSSDLRGVSCTSPRDCWAVGSFSNTGGPRLNQALHWNGRQWSLIATPNPGGTAQTSRSELLGVACPLRTSCWAVGTYATSSSLFLNQALHWNGRTWSLVPTPNPGRTANRAFDSLAGVRCTSASNCWAVGSFASAGTGVVELNQALHWNGRTWSLVPTPNPGRTANGAFDSLAGVRCTSPADCWAVGIFGQGAGDGTAFRNQALHWNGRKWSQVATPEPGGISAGAGNELLDMTCTSSTSCWAVGDYGSMNGGTNVVLNQALHWNGHRWSLISTPDPGGTANSGSNFLNGIRCPSPASCWAVGSSQAGGRPNLNQALHWNGTSWSIG